MTENTSKTIKYNLDNPLYTELETKDKVNFAFYMMKYDVNDKKEIAEGAKEFKEIKNYSDIFKLDKPQNVITRISNLIIFLAILLIIIVFVFWLVLVIIGSNPIKKQLIFYVFLFLVGLLCLIFLIDWVYKQVVDKKDILENVIV